MPSVDRVRGVLVTGASRGIGAAVARAFASAGDRVAVHYGRNEALANDVAASLSGDGHMVVGADLADADGVRRMVDGASGGLGGLDVLVNNAGVFARNAITETTYDQWQSGWKDPLAVNLIGAANVAWCAVQHMIRGGGGKIVNVASRGAFRGEPTHPAYGASKAGIVAFDQSLARALAGHGIAVTAVAPGFVETDMARRSFLANRASGGGRRARSAGWRPPKTWPPRSFSWPPLRRRWPVARWWTSTGRPTCGCSC